MTTPIDLAHLYALSDGWLDGSGKAPDPAGLDWLAENLAEHYPDDLPTPRAYPTYEGGVMLEWDIGRWYPSLEVDLAAHTGYWHVLDRETGDGQEETVNLDWDWRLAAAEVADQGVCRESITKGRIMTTIDPASREPRQPQDPEPPRPDALPPLPVPTGPRRPTFFNPPSMAEVLPRALARLKALTPGERRELMVRSEGAEAEAEDTERDGGKAHGDREVEESRESAGRGVANTGRLDIMDGREGFGSPNHARANLLLVTRPDPDAAP